MKTEKQKYDETYAACQAGGMNETDSHDMATDHATRPMTSHAPDDYKKENQPIQIGPSLELYLCPACHLNHSRCRWMDAERKQTVLGCNAVCAKRMIQVRNRFESDFNRGLGLIAKAGGGQ